MKRAGLWLAPALAAALLFSGCGGGEVYEVEQLRIMQTLGVDKSPGGVRVSLAAASGPGAGDEARCFSGEGRSISDGLERVRSRSMEEQLFCGHLRQLLLGQALAESGPEPLLSFVCRSPDARLDTPLFLVRGGSAGDLMAETGSGDKSVSELLQAEETRLRARTGAPPFTAADLLRGLERSGAGVVWAVEQSSPSERKPEEEPADALKGAGLAVLNQQRLLGFLNEEETLGTCLLLEKVAAWDYVLELDPGKTVCVELREERLQAEPVWSRKGELKGLSLSLRLSAVVLDAPAGFDPGGDRDGELLSARLETALAGCVRAALDRAREWQADFPALGLRIERAAPLRWRQTGISEQLPAALPELSVRVGLKIEQSGDVKEAGG